MKLIPILLVAAFLALAPTVVADEVAPFLPLASVQPLQFVDDDHHLVNICSSFSINQEKGYWATANHCVHEGVEVDGVAVKFIYQDETRDLAVYEGRKVKAIKVAGIEPKVGDEVILIGYPYGALDPLVFYGHTSNPLARLTPVLTAAVYNVLGLPGDSGGPILNKDFELVGMAQMSTMSGACYGTPWRDIIATLGLLATVK